jgi:pimeloyl-ACP methyl ester carboxylesterase
MAAAHNKSKAGPTAYEATGSGPPVVLIHGVGLDRTIWEAQAVDLATRFRVVRYDMLGHGESDHPGGARQLADFVRQLGELLDYLEVERTAVVGFSMGGLVARAFALAEPERVSRMALISTVYRRTLAESEAVRTRLRQAEEEGPAGLIEAALERWFTPEFGSHHPDIIAGIRQRLEANDPAAFLAAYRIFAEADAALTAFLLDRGLDSEGLITSPLLVMTGEEDTGSTPAMARRMVADYPDARCEILRGLRHLALVEAPRAVTGPLIWFLSRGSVALEIEERKA